MNDRERRIRERAFDLWQQGGCVHGHDLEHSQAAEQAIDAEETAGTGMGGNKPAEVETRPVHSRPVGERHAPGQKPEGTEA
jgi:hypothetical protein